MSNLNEVIFFTSFLLFIALMLGIDLVEVMPTGPDPVAWVTRLGEEVVPRLAELGGP